MICAPPDKGTSNDFADWLELQAFGSPGGTAPLADINEAYEIEEDVEPDELDKENVELERRLQMLVTALDERAKVMGETYPFARDPEGIRITLKPELTPGGFAYLFCLVVSNSSKGGFLAGDGGCVPDMDEARKLFQICATVSAAGHARGPSFSVGWPRPDSSDFIAKLKGVYDLFGDGKVYDEVPPGAPDQVKDDEIDVISWTHAFGTKPPLGYFLGQAASGANWDGKSLKGSIDTFHGTWFSQQPASKADFGIIIPYILPTEADAMDEPRNDHEDQEEIEGELRRRSLDFGKLLFRHRVARFVDEGNKLAAQGIQPIERLDHLDQIEGFVKGFQAQLATAMGKK
jgi:hypothetical protein